MDTTCDEILSWTIDVWINNHFVGDNNLDLGQLPKNL